MKLENNTGLIKNTALGLILLIIVLYLFQVFTENPLEGTWVNPDMDLSLEIRQEGKAILTWEDTDEIELSYEIGREEKEITFIRSSETMNYLRTAELPEEESEDIEFLIDSFGYSVEGQTLTLQERDFGDEIIFTKEK